MIKYLFVAVIACCGSSCHNAWLEGEGAEQVEFRRSSDLSDEIYHRVVAGFFVPECEPLVYRLAKQPERRDGNGFVRFNWEFGTFAVGAQDNGLIAVYLDENAAYGHISVAPSNDLSSASLVFMERPTHPIR